MFERQPVSRASRRRGPAPLPIRRIAFAAGAMALVVGLLAVPAVRAAVGTGFRSVAKQVRNDLGVPEVDGRLLVVHLLDNSGSSVGAKQDIVKQALAATRCAGIDAKTAIWRYAEVEELIHTGVNSERLLKPVLRDYYASEPPSTGRGTHLGRALEAVEAMIREWKREHPGGTVFVSIGTDGGVEDIARARTVARRLADQRVICLVHGVRVKSRLREQVTDALRPLEAARLLHVCNQGDFAQVSETAAKALRDAIDMTSASGRRP